MQRPTIPSDTFGDAVVGPIWLFVNLLLVATAWLLSRRTDPRGTLAVRIMHVVVLCWACIVANVFVLQILGQLQPMALLTAVGISSALVLCWLIVTEQGVQTRGHFKTDSPPAGRTKDQRFTPHPASPLKGRGGIETSSTQRPVTGNVRSNATTKKRWVVWRHRWCWTTVWGLLAAWALLTAVNKTWSEYPMDPDTLAYHLPLVDHWIREGTLYVPDCAFWYCPGNSELLTLWLVGPLSGDFWSGLNNLPAVLLLGAASFTLLSELRVLRPLRHLASLGIVVSGPVWRQLESNENDVAAAALFVACLAYSLRYARSGRMGELAMCSVTFGLLAGVKYYALGYAGAAGLGLLMLLMLRRNWGRAAKAFAMGLGGLLVFGSYWYIRNWLATGAPLFPKGWSEANDVWDVMRPGNEMSSVVRSIGRPGVPQLLMDTVLDECGLLFWFALGLVPATLIILAFVSQIPGVRTFRSRSRMWLLTVLLLSLLVFVNTPNIVEVVPETLNMLRILRRHPPRLGFCALVISVIAFTVAVSDAIRSISRKSEATADRGHLWKLASRWGRWIVLLVIYALFMVQVAMELEKQVIERLSMLLAIVSVDLFLFGVIVWACTRSRQRIVRLVPVGLVIASLGGMSWATSERSGRWHRGFTEHYSRHFGSEIFSEASRLAKQAGKLCVCDSMYYPFLGSRRQHVVCRPLWFPSSDGLLTYVDENQVELITVRDQDRSLQRRYAGVKVWIVDHPEIFRPVYEDGAYALYDVNRNALESRLNSQPEREIP